MDSHILSEGKEFDKSSSSSVTENEDSEPLIASLPGVAMFELPLSNQDGEDISSSDLVVTELQEDGEQERPQQAADPIEGMDPKDAIDAVEDLPSPPLPPSDTFPTDEEPAFNSIENDDKHLAIVSRLLSLENSFTSLSSFVSYDGEDEGSLVAPPPLFADVPEEPNRVTNEPTISITANGHQGGMCCICTYVSTKHIAYCYMARCIHDWGLRISLAKKSRDRLDRNVW